jgi:ATP-dependent exoDNAse (exonuclease V) alpha subunit
MIGRSAGRSAVACAAYRSGERLIDERYGKVHDYEPRRGVTTTGILAPEGAPPWALNRESLWNRAEAAEKRKDAQVAREFEISLPHQVDVKEYPALVEEFIRQELLPRGMVVDYAIHSPNGRGDERNWHAHLMTTLRPLDGNQFSAIKDRDACADTMILRWREAWANIQNQTLERLGTRDAAGQQVRVDHRSFEARGLDLEPTLHMGPLATAMERSGKPTEIGDMNRAIIAENQHRLLRRRAAHLTSGEALSLLLAEQSKEQILRELNEELTQRRPIEPEP